MESEGKGGGEKKKKKNKKKKKKKTFFSHVFYLNYFYERKRVAVVVVVIVCCYSNETHAHIHTLIPAFSAHRYCDFLRFSILPIFSRTRVVSLSRMPPPRRRTKNSFSVAAVSNSLPLSLFSLFLRSDSRVSDCSPPLFVSSRTRTTARPTLL